MHTIAERPRPARARALTVAMTVLTLTAAGLATGPTAWAAQGHRAAAGPATSTSGLITPLKVTEPTVAGELEGVTKVSAKDVWAVGYAYPSPATTLAEQYNGTSWQVVSTPNPAGATTSVLEAVTSKKTNVWAVGTYVNGSTKTWNTLAEEYTGSSWQIVPTRNPSGAIQSQLYAVAAVSAKNVWAVGLYVKANGHTYPLVEHWTGKTWKLVTSPNPSGSTSTQLEGVSAVSGKDVWVVGHACDASGACSTLTEQYNGTTWQVVTGPSLGSESYLSAVAETSAGDVWAVGQAAPPGGSSGTLAEQWNGTSWQAVTTPVPSGSTSATFAGVAPVSASDVWAVGQYDNGTTCTVFGCPLAEQWNGTSWQVVATPNDSAATQSPLDGVAAVSAKNVWAVGWVTIGTTAQTLIEHWNGSKWTIVED